MCSPFTCSQSFILVQDIHGRWLKLALMPPFQKEGAEKNAVPLFRRLKPKPFGIEGEEVETRPAKRNAAGLKRPFQDEISESELEGSEAECEQPDPVFSLGWSSLRTFVKTTAWDRHAKEVAEEERLKRKRTYNNAKRAASADASGKRQKSDVFGTSGRSHDRILSLVKRTCSCALSHKHVAVFSCESPFQKHQP